jgi:hypothetical protein
MSPKASTDKNRTLPQDGEYQPMVIKNTDSAGNTADFRQ